MRVTDSMRYTMATQNMSALASRQLSVAQQAQTGLRVNAPSDDPIAAAQLARLATVQTQISARQSTISSVRGDAELSESSLQEASDLMARAKELATQGANGSLDASDRAVIATQVKDILDQLVALGNTKGATGYLFGGSQTGTTPFSATGAFSGDDGQHTVDIGNSTPTAVNSSGAQAFTAAGGRDVFGDVTALYTALSSNDTAGITATLTNLDTSRAQISQAEANAGTIINKLDASTSVLSTASLDSQQQTTTLGAVDAAAAYSNLTALNNSLQRSASVAQQILSVESFKSS
jgi:flagellar hook-associated protein 3 FlgL